MDCRCGSSNRAPALPAQVNPKVQTTKQKKKMRNKLKEVKNFYNETIKH
jgi:hypothetical protein